ncbi:MAG: tartrate dehydrogenase [Pseudomonadota bacterium]
MQTFRIAVLPGDGIGKEVIPKGIEVLESASRDTEFQFEWTEFDWSCETYKKTGRMMPEDAIDTLAAFDAIYLGAVGFPGVPDHVSLWGMLIPIRRGFDQYVNLRPVRQFEGMRSPLSGPKPGDIDFIVVRENVEGEYSSIGGVQFGGSDREMVVQESVFTRKGTDRILRFAFELASQRAKRLTSATKSNGIFHSMPYWDSRVIEMAKQYEYVGVESFHIDILTANFVLMPEHFDVVVGSNLFGDILSDLGPACAGTIAIAPSANLNPERSAPSMFEPVHGSAPDIAGKGIANPLGTIWAGALMAEHLGATIVHDRIMASVETAIREGANLTPDMGGGATTAELGNEVSNAARG